MSNDPPGSRLDTSRLDNGTLDNGTLDNGTLDTGRLPTGRHWSKTRSRRTRANASEAYVFLEDPFLKLLGAVIALLSIAVPLSSVLVVPYVSPSSPPVLQ